MPGNEIIQVWLNDTAPIVFGGDPNFQNPQQDILDKINNQQKLLSKVYQFNSVKSNWYYVTKYTYWGKPNYVHTVFEKTIRAERTKTTDQTFNRAWWVWYTEQIPVMSNLRYSTLDSFVVNNWTFVIDRAGRYDVTMRTNLVVTNMSWVTCYLLNYTDWTKYRLQQNFKDVVWALLAPTDVTLFQTREIYFSAPCEIGPVLWYRGTTANWAVWSVKVLWDWWSTLTNWGTGFQITKKMENWLFY